MSLRVIWQYMDRSIYCHMTFSAMNYLLQNSIVLFFKFLRKNLSKNGNVYIIALLCTGVFYWGMKHKQNTTISNNLISMFFYGVSHHFHQYFSYIMHFHILIIAIFIHRLLFGFLFLCFSNISAISWRPVLVVEEAGVPGENHRPWTRNWQTFITCGCESVHLFLSFTKPVANPRRIGDRLV